MQEYAADFEANTWEHDCRVWAWGIAEVGREPEQSFVYGTDIASFVVHVMGNPGRYWFHNLSYDGNLLTAYLLGTGWKWVPEKPRAGEFTTLISDMGKWYSMQIGGGLGKIVIADSFKKFPMSLARVAQAYGLEMTKGEIDYSIIRHPGAPLGEAERDYLERDVCILAEALHKRLALGTRLTTGSDCLHNFKEMTGEDRFKRLFPVVNPLMDKIIRRAYRGGWVYVNPKIKGQVVGEGARFDVNSLYPWCQRENLMPYGEPKRFTSEPKPSEAFPLWIAEAVLVLDLKPGRYPCVQERNVIGRGDRDYIERTGEPVTLSFCSVDWELMRQCYDVAVIEWRGGYLFRAVRGLYDAYIDAGMQGKTHAANPGERQNYKLWLNNLGGKFAQRTDVVSRMPELGYDGIVRYRPTRGETREPVYTAAGVFMTAYGRLKTVSTANRFGERFCYADTDSCHVLGTDTPEWLDVDSKRLGAWDKEAVFSRAKFLRCKTYAETVDGRDEYTCAGMSYELRAVMRFEDFEPGFACTPCGFAHPGGCGRECATCYSNSELWGLRPKSVPGGVILEPRPFTIKA